MMIRINSIPKTRKAKIAGLALLLVLAIGCASRPTQFKAATPVWCVNDTSGVPLPTGTHYEEVYYYFNSIIRQPVNEALDPRAIARAGDVNAWDDLPASTWFTPRLGYQRLSADTIARGAWKYGPPHMPMTVSHIKSEGSNPGFIVNDARGVKYLVKFDVDDYPGIETSTGQIVNRLFWAFGYNVPEDYQFWFKPEDLLPNQEKGIIKNEIQAVLDQVPADPDGRYRSMASRFIEGSIIGPIPEHGIRKDDPYDLVPHQDRRILRAMHVFCAFTNHSGIRVDNTMDSYVGEPAKGYVRHYLLDFGEAFGGHGAEHDWLWDGFTHRLDLGEMFKNYFSFGLRIQPWETLTYTSYPSVGAFESKVFDPKKWKETYQFLPIRRSQPDDDYWATKIVASLTPNQIERLIREAEYPDSGAEQYMVQTLLERQQKVLEYFFNQVTSLDPSGLSPVQQDSLVLFDSAVRFGIENVSTSSYKTRFLDRKGRELKTSTLLSCSEKGLVVINDLNQISSGYLIVDVLALRDGVPAPRTAQFHLAPVSGKWALIGVVH